MREATAQGLKVPTKEEWEEIIEPDKAFVLGLPLSGYRNTCNADYYYQGTNGHYWSSSPYTTNAYGVIINSTQVLPLYHLDKGFGFTVRCIMD
jgi:uncharacterized protein (TIGR02145 family)